MMNPFCFQTVPTIYVQWDGSANLSNIIKKYFHIQNILIITTENLVKRNIFIPIIHGLTKENYTIFTFDNIESDPSEQTVLTCTEYAKQNKIELVIGIGGGSVIDVAKHGIYINTFPTKY